MAAYAFDVAALSDALEGAGYDVAPPSLAGDGSPAVVSARREGVAGGVAVVVVDRGGRLKFTLTRDLAPERARNAVVAGQRCRLVDTTTRTTVAVLTLAEGADLAALLADLERAAAR